MIENNLFSGNDIIALPADMNKPLVKSILWENNVVIMIGKAGIAKSIFTQQLAFSLSCGEPFLAEYESRKICVLYVQAEGTLGETKKRFNNMLHRLPWDGNNLYLMFLPGLILNREDGLNSFIRMVDSIPRPSLIILDPLYMCTFGNLCDQDEATRTCKALAMLKNRYNCAIWIVHHEHRPKMNEGGNYINEGSESLYGSMVWQAFADTIFGFVGSRGGGREFLCYKQRSGEVVSKIELSFIEPIPLLFEIKGEVSPYIKVVEMNMGSKPLNVEQLESATNLSYNSINKALTYLRKHEKIRYVGDGYPRQWVKV